MRDDGLNEGIETWSVLPFSAMVRVMLTALGARIGYGPVRWGRVALELRLTVCRRLEP